MILSAWTKIRPYLSPLIRVIAILTITATAILASPTVQQLETQVRSAPSAYGPNIGAPLVGSTAMNVAAYYAQDRTYGFTGQQIRVQYRNPMFGWDCPPCVSTMYVYIDGAYQGAVYTDGNSSWREFYTNPVTWGYHTVTFRTVNAPWAGMQEWHDLGTFYIYGWADTTPPNQTITYSTTAWTSNNVAVTLRATDAVSGIKLNQYRFKPDSTGTWSGWTSCGTGNCNVTVTQNGQFDHYSQDKALVVARSYPRVNNIDKTAPSAVNPANVSSPPAFPHNTWVKAGGLIAWDWPDASDSGSGVDGYRVYFGSDPAGSSAAIQGNSDYSTDITADGIYYLRSQVVDLTGNASLWSNLYTVRVDSANPVSLPTANGGTAWDNSTWFNSDTTLGLQTTDNLSGVNLSRFRIDGGAWSGGTISMTTDGIYSIDYQAEDVAGNAISGTRTFQLDKTSPGLVSTIPSVDGSNGWYVTTPTVTVSGSDALSGVAAEEISLDGGGNWGASPQTLSDGTYSVILRTRDAAGNETTENHTIKVDAAAPALSPSPSGTSGNAGWYTSDTTINHTYSDATSGLMFSQMQINGGGWQPIMDQTFSDGVYSIEYSLQDEAGNHTSVTEVLQVDTIPPTRTVTVPAATGNSSWHRTQPTIEVSGTDDGSGLDAAEISLNGGATWIPDQTTLADGIHMATFKVTDVAGNESQETRTIKVDATDPTITETVTGTSGAGGWYTSNVTVSAVTNDATSGVIGDEMRVDGGGWTVIGSTLLTDGEHTVEYRAEDEAGNIASRTVTVNVDTTPPAANISTTGVMGSNSWYTTDVGVEVSGTDSGSGLDTAEISLDGGATWIPDQTTLSDGVHTATLKVTDVAGNQSQETRTIKVDTTDPTILESLTGTSGSGGWYTSNVLVNAVTNDATSGVISEEMRVDGGIGISIGSTTLTDGEHTVEYRVEDEAGNIASRTVTVNVDTTPPAADISTTGVMGSNSWYTTDVGVEVSGTDSGSGPDTAEISLDGGATWIPDQSTLSDDGIHTLTLKVTDVAGNESQETRTIKVDTTDPTITETLTGTSGAGGWYTSNVTVGAVTDDATSGVIGEEMRVDSGTWTPIMGLLTDGEHVVEYRVEDEAGNIASHTVTVNVDTTPPTANVSVTGTKGANGWYTSDVTLDLASSDATSGVAQEEYQDGILWDPYIGTMTLTNGTSDIRFRVTDAAGNVALTPPVTYRVDTTPPEMEKTLQGSINPSGWSNDTVELTGNAADDGSGLLSFEVNINGAGWVDAASADLDFTDDGVYEILCRAIDTAGNATEEPITVQIDKTPPVSGFTNPPEGTTVTVTDGTFVLTGATTDNLSGTTSAEISLDNGLTWRALDTTAGWSYTWDTKTVPDGTYPVLVRAVDRADNHEHTAQVTLVVENDRPVIEVPSSWYIWEDAPLRVSSKEKIKEVSIRIYDSQGRWEYYVEYDGNSIPLYVRWNRIFDFDSQGRPIYAPPGVYLVEIIAKNERNRDTVVHSTIVIPDIGSGSALEQSGLPEAHLENNENALENNENAPNTNLRELQEQEVPGSGTFSESAASWDVSDLITAGVAQWQKVNQLWQPLLGGLLILLGLLLALGLWAFKGSSEDQKERG